MQDFVTVYLGLGSNMGNREAHLEDAVRAIEQLPNARILRRSAIYESKPWGPVKQPDYLNMVVEISTQLDPESLLLQCKAIEEQQGRVPGERWGPRPIDIDILLYGDDQIDISQVQNPKSKIQNLKSLTVPHPRMWERAFVLRPLADLAPDLRTPGGTPILELLQHQEIASQGVRPYSQKLPRNER